MADRTVDRILAALSGDDGAQREKLAALCVDHVLDQKIKDLVDFEEARSITTRALSTKNLERIFERHVIPGYKRYDEVASKSGDTVGGFVPDAARDAIIEIIQKSKLPRGKWTDGAVDRVLIRRLFAPVWTNLLLSFAKRLPIPGISGSSGGGAPSSVGRGVSGIAGRLTRTAKEQAERLVDAGKTVMGGLGSEVERRMQGAAKEFSDGAAEVFREALQDRLKSAEGRDIVAQISRQATDHVLVTKISEIHVDVARFPVEDVLKIAPSIISHSAPRAFVERLVRAEIDAFLSVEGDRPLRDVLAELGIFDEVRALAVARVCVLARSLFESPAFRDWLGAVAGG